MPSQNGRIWQRLETKLKGTYAVCRVPGHSREKKKGERGKNKRKVILLCIRSHLQIPSPYLNCTSALIGSRVLIRSHCMAVCVSWGLPRESPANPLNEVHVGKKIKLLPQNKAELKTGRSLKL